MIKYILLKVILYILKVKIINQYNNQNFIEIRRAGFTEVDNWELISFFKNVCYENTDYKWLFQGTLNIQQEISLYGRKFNGGDDKWVGNEIIRELFDFLKYSCLIENQKYNIYALVLRTKGIYLYNYNYQIWNFGGWNKVVKKVIYLLFIGLMICKHILTT